MVARRCTQVVVVVSVSAGSGEQFACKYGGVVANAAARHSNQFVPSFVSSAPPLVLVLLAATTTTAVAIRSGLSGR